MKSESIHKFQSVTKNEWFDKIKQDLKGRGITELDWTISEDIKISPFVHREDAPSPSTPLANVFPNNNWQIGERFDTKDLKQANTEIIFGLESGINSIKLKIEKDFDSKDFELLFNEINLEYISVDFIIDQQIDVALFISNFITYLELRKLSLRKIYGSVKSEIVGLEIKLFSPFYAVLPGFSFHCLQSNNLHGADDLVSSGLANLLVQALQIADCSETQKSTLASFTFELRLSHSFFLNIAKVRALKILWANFVTAYGCNYPAKITVTVSEKLLKVDEHYNMIQLAAQGVAASSAGVYSIYMPPYDLKSDKKSSVRYARNISLLLQLESYFDKVIDASAGSYYVEALTDQLTAKAWTIFQQASSKLS